LVCNKGFTYSKKKEEAAALKQIFVEEPNITKHQKEKG
jgi:hypothetical protein